ncbi:hypothetical protein KFU94_51800, partial [Chloroflexi bacterium TSY]|nr:hypothetical protein [Chloroflexi bacterium TSY]
MHQRTVPSLLNILLSFVLVLSSTLPALASPYHVAPSLIETKPNRLADSDYINQQRQSTSAAHIPRQATQIAITNSGFQPDEVTVTVGTEVTWVNNTQVTHRLQSGLPLQLFLPVINSNSSPVVRSAQPATIAQDEFAGDIAPGASFRHTFTEPGEYPFYLTTSFDHQGRVIVEKETDTPTATATSTATPSDTPTSTNTPMSDEPTATPAVTHTQPPPRRRPK